MGPSMLHRLKSSAEFLASITRYRDPVKSLINMSPVATEIRTGRDVTIGWDCVLRGDIDLSDGTAIEDNCLLRGEISTGRRVTIGTGGILRGKVTVGSRTNLVRDNEVIGDVEFGKYCAIAPHALFQEKNHTTNKACLQTDFYREVLDSDPEYTSKGRIRIGNDVWVGARSLVLSGVNIGDGAIVAGGSVVTDDVEPYSIVAGSPAVHKRWRFPEAVREELLDIEWWEWDTRKIRENEEFFTSELDKVHSVHELVDDI